MRPRSPHVCAVFALLVLWAASAVAAPKAQRYLVYRDGAWHKMGRRDLVKVRRSGATLWSARLSTGLLGTTRCHAGNRGPKSPHEVVLAVGDGGLRKLVQLGFVGCPACKPHAAKGFWSAIKHTVREVHGLRSLAQFNDRHELPFDASRVRFEDILPHLDVPGGPGRLYVPPTTTLGALAAIKQRFEALGLAVPEVGYYDRSAKGRFTRLALPK